MKIDELLEGVINIADLAGATGLAKLTGRTTLKAGTFLLIVTYTYDATHIKKIIGTLTVE